MKIFKIIVMLFALLSLASAGPFGLEMGMKIEDIDKNAKKTGDGMYEVSVPEPHKKFKDYIVYTCPSRGLYAIRAVGHNIHTSVYGTELKSEFETIEKKLAKVYGKYKKFDMLASGSIWNEPRDWMRGLLKKERTLATFWYEGSNADLKNNIDTLMLEAIALNRNIGVVVLQYEFSNKPACKAEIESKDDSSL